MCDVKFFWNDPIDELIIRDSWQQAFNRTIPEETWIKIWQWKFKSNPFCDKVLAAYVMEQDTIASFYTVSPMTVIHPDGTKIKSGLMNMGFTHPNFQGKGYYLEMNQLMHQELRNMGYEFLFGFANHNSHYSYRKYLDWQDISLLTTFRLLKNSIRSGFQKYNKYKTIDIALRDSVIDNIGNSFVTKSKYHILRSAPFLKWRLTSHPTEKYFCLSTIQDGLALAYTIYKFYGSNEADIMEIFYTSEDLIGSPEILKSIVSCLLNKGFSSINIWSNLFGESHLAFEKIGFQEYLVNTHFGVIDFSARDDLTLITNWHYRFLDSDVY